MLAVIIHLLIVHVPLYHPLSEGSTRYIAVVILVGRRMLAQNGVTAHMGSRYMDFSVLSAEGRFVTPEPGEQGFKILIMVTCMSKIM